MRRLSASFFRLAASLVAGGAIASVLATKASAAGMPQMEFSNPLITAQAAWVLVIFFLLYLAVKHFSIPQIEAVIANRRQRIGQDLESARQAKAQADKAVATLNKARQEAAAEAQAHIDRIISQSRSSATEQIRAVNTRLDQAMRESESRVAEARDKALAEVDQMAREAAESLIKQLLGEDVDRAMLKSKISQVVATKS